MKLLNPIYGALIAAIGLLLVIDVFEITVAVGLAAIVYGAYKVVVSITK